MRDVTEIAEEFSSIVPRDKLLSLFEDANELSARYVIVSLKLKDRTLRYLKGVNVIFTYLPHISKVMNVNIEFLISKDVSARDFLTRHYKELVGLGGSVAIGDDGISVFLKLGLRNCRRKLEDLIRKVVRIIEGIDLRDEVHFEYVGSRFIHYE